MIEGHLTETELAQLSEEAVDQDLKVHVEGCLQCRQVAADYGWVEGEIAAALQAKAGGVPVPERSWQAVRDQVRQGDHRSGRRRLLVVAGVASILLATIIGPWLLDSDVEVQRASSFAAVTAPAPPATTGLMTRVGPARPQGTTSESIRHSREAGGAVPFGPPPTPPENQG